MREIMIKMIENYDNQLVQVEAEIVTKKILNPAHELYRKQLWLKAKSEAVKEVLAEYDKEIRQNK